VRKLRLVFAFIVLPVVLGSALVACGGGGESRENGDQEGKVVSAIETSATSTDPADCRKLATLTFLEQTQFAKGSYAVKGCEEDARETKNDPESVEVTNVKVDGSQATADVSFTGGTFDGQTLSVALVEEQGGWKMGEIVGFAHFDQERLAGAFEEELTIGNGAISKTLASCIGEGFGELPQGEFEEVFLSGDSHPLEEVLKECQEGP